MTKERQLRTKTVHCGTFDAERFWRSKNLARLPSLSNSLSASIVDAMDEMLFLFCRDGDILLTRRPLDQAHLDYIRSIGFDIRANRFALASDCEEEDRSIFELLNQPGNREGLSELIGKNAFLEPFSILPGTFETLNRFKFMNKLPEEETVAAVNAKCYSVAMRDRLGIPNIALIVDSVEALLAEGSRMLQNGPLIVKDDYGVSGKGNLVVESERMLRRIATYAEREAQAGNVNVRYILEPRLAKAVDFSCQFKVESSGEVQILSLQQLENNGFGFGSSLTPPGDFLERLASEGYFEQMSRVGEILHKDGYWGDVCVDSMLLEDGSLEPLVEINARKSMSLTKRAADKFLAMYGLTACLTQWAVAPETGSFTSLLHKLSEEKLLFEPGLDGGVIPLTSGTLYDGTASRIKGKMYGIIAYREREQLEQMSRRVGDLLNSSESHALN